MKKKDKPLLQRWEDVAQTITEWSGKPWTFGLAVLIVVVWAATGPLFGFSDTWQLVINTGTTIITFLMVFIIQQTQNKDTQALELKLNEIVAAISGASNRLIDVESLTSAELASPAPSLPRASRTGEKGKFANQLSLDRGSAGTSQEKKSK